MAKQVLDKNGVLYLWGKVKSLVSGKVDKETGKGLSTNDLTDTLKSNYDAAYTHSTSAHAPSNAERNAIVGVQKNGTDVSIDASTRKVNITVPTKTSDLNNDSGFLTTADIPEGAAASTTAPKMDGTATVGTEMAFARGDHIHPSDTTKVDKVAGKGLSTNDYTTNEKNKLAGIAEGANNYTLPDATTSVKGGVKLSTSTSSTSTTTAATPSAVKAAYDLANGKQSPATSLSGYGITDAYTKTEIDTKIGDYYTKEEVNAKVSSVYKYKGSVASYSALPKTDLTIGDVYNVETASENNRAGDNMAWNGTAWDNLAGLIDLSGYVQDSDIVAITNSEIDDITK